MKSNYSLYAKDAHIEIQNLNDNLQLDLEKFQMHDIYDMNYTNKFFNKLKNKIICHIEKSNDVLINYCNQKHDYYINMKKYYRFQLSAAFEEFIDTQLDIINTEFTMSYLSDDITNSIVFKYINLKILYDSILNDTDKLNMYDDDLNDTNGHNKETIIMLIEHISSEFYDYIDNINMICADETDVLNLIGYYIFNLRIISYVIKFIESIRLI